ncbi:MAG: hypothetical protein WBM69_08565 [Desulfobacterales bacterium]
MFPCWLDDPGNPVCRAALVGLSTFQEHTLQHAATVRTGLHCVLRGWTVG